MTKVVLNFKNIGLNMYEEIRKNLSRMFILSRRQGPPPRMMFCDCFTFEGTNRLITVEGIMSCIKYKEILTYYLLSTIRVAFPKGDCIFQQDLAMAYLK